MVIGDLTTHGQGWGTSRGEAAACTYTLQELEDLLLQAMKLMKRVQKVQKGTLMKYWVAFYSPLKNTTGLSHSPRDKVIMSLSSLQFSSSPYTHTHEPKLAGWMESEWNLIPQLLLTWEKNKFLISEVDGWRWLLKIVVVFLHMVENIGVVYKNWP